jgi:hypothetical protein
MRIAILIGVSKYDTHDDLPGCAKDAAAMQAMLKASQTFDQVECFDKDTNAAQLKADLSNIFRQLKGQSIDELLFYFSGHGMYHIGDFYYALTDFDDSTIRQTSLQNSEIDNQIKSLGPKLVVKIIDACQSGVAYIKGKEEIRSYYEKSIGGFENCYFMHSSMSNQSSFGTANISAFTGSILSAVVNTTQTEIRYKHVIDYVSDEFEGNTRQTPFFVAQADHTEVFLPVTTIVKQAIGKFIKSAPKVRKPAVTKTQETKQPLLDRVKKDAEDYATHEETKTLLNGLQVLLESAVSDQELAGLYEKQVHASDVNELPKKLFIGRWLQQNIHEYFAVPTFTEETYEEEIAQPIFMSIAQMMRPNRTAIRHRQVLTGYDLTAEVPFKCIYINFRPLYPNLPHYSAMITFIFSKKEIRFFHALVAYKERSWTTREISTDFDWETTTFQLKDVESIKAFMNKCFNDFSRFVLETIRKKFNSTIQS